MKACYLQDLATGGEFTMGTSQRRKRAKAAREQAQSTATMAAGSTISSTVAASETADIGLKVETAAGSSTAKSSGEMQSADADQQPGRFKPEQQDIVQPSPVKTNLPRVCISSLKRTASPTPQAPTSHAAEAGGADHDGVPSMTPSKGLSGVAGAVPTAAAKRLKTSPQHEASDETSLGKHLHEIRDLSGKPPSQSGLSEDQLLALKLADAPGPAVLDKDKVSSISTLIASPAPTPDRKSVV